MIKEAKLENFKDLIKENITLVDFWAPWCGPCRMLSPILEEISIEKTDIKIVKVNVDDNAAIAKEYGVMSIPTLLLFKDGKLEKQTVGFMQKEDLINWIEN